MSAFAKFGGAAAVDEIGKRPAQPNVYQNAAGNLEAEKAFKRIESFELKPPWNTQSRIHGTLSFSSHTTGRAAA
jgi:hypothetical protein